MKEYRVVVEHTAYDFEKSLNECADEGFEVTRIFYFPQHRNFVREYIALMEKTVF